MHELVKRARAEPGKVAIGAAAILSQMALEEFNRSAGIQSTRVPYKGSAEVAQATVAGDIDAAFDGIAPYVQFAKAGRAKILGLRVVAALLGPARGAHARGAGLQGRGLLGLVRHRRAQGLPPEIVARERGVDWALHQPDVVEKLLRVLASSPRPRPGRRRSRRASTPTSARYAPVIRRLGFKLD